MQITLLGKKLNFETLFLLLLAGLSVACFEVWAQDQERLVEQRIEDLTYDNTIPPQDILEELPLLRIESEQNGWDANALRAILLEIEVRLLLEQITEAEQKFKQANELAERIGIDELSIRLELSQLRVLTTKGLSRQTFELQQSLINRALLIEEPGYAASVFQAVGDSQQMTKDLVGAINQFQSAYKLFKQVGNEGGVSDALNSMASLYVELRDYEKAIEYSKESLAIRQAMSDDFNISIILFNLGDIYLAANQVEKALKAYHDSLAMSLALDDHIGVGWTQQALANVMFQQQQYEEALVLYQKTTDTFRQSGDGRKVLTSLLGQIRCLIALDNDANLDPLITETRTILDDIENEKFENAFIEVKALVAAHQGEFKIAYQLYKQFAARIQLQEQASSIEQVQRLRVAFDTEKVQNENSELQIVSALQQEKIAQQERERQMWLAIIILSVVLIMAVIISLVKITKHRNRLKKLAYKDVLTNSPNRRAILEFARCRYEQVRQSQGSMLIVMIDLDNFKKINDTYGHQVGDDVLQAFADACRASLRKQDRFGRYGGEEWLLVITDSLFEDAQNIFTRLRHNLNSASIPDIPENELITFSMGVSQLKTGDNVEFNALISIADESLYEAKESGKDRFVAVT